MGKVFPSWTTLIMSGWVWMMTTRIEVRLMFLSRRKLQAQHQYLGQIDRDVVRKTHFGGFSDDEEEEEDDEVRNVFSRS
jgi:hypothetical protein